MKFAYYDRLSPAQKRTYEKSDAITRIEVANIRSMQPHVTQIERALDVANRAAIEQACQALANALNTQLRTPPIRVKVLERRPSDDYGELHGLYEPEHQGHAAVITVWMRTAQKEQVVKFRTFLRTLVHEVCHHIDYEHYHLADTFHTEGFYKRESVMLKELLGEPVIAEETPPPAPPPRGRQPAQRRAGAGSASPKAPSKAPPKPPPVVVVKKRSS